MRYLFMYHEKKGITYLVTQLPCNYLSLLDFLTARLLALFLAKIAGKYNLFPKRRASSFAESVALQS